jgi:hypothetical protein
MEASTPKPGTVTELATPEFVAGLRPVHAMLAYLGREAGACCAAFLLDELEGTEGNDYAAARGRSPLCFGLQE